MRTKLTPNEMITHFYTNYSNLSGTFVMAIIATADAFNSGKIGLDEFTTLGYWNGTVGDLLSDFGIEVQRTEFPSWVEDLTSNIEQEINVRFPN